MKELESGRLSSTGLFRLAASGHGQDLSSTAPGRTAELALSQPLCGQQAPMPLDSASFHLLLPSQWHGKASEETVGNS